MAGILDLINSDLGKQIIGGIGNQVGTTEEETSSVLSSALPTLVNAMQNNTQSEEGAGGLLGALLGGKHDGGLLDNLGGLLGGGMDTQDGGKILGHVLGDNQASVEAGLSQNTGVSSDKVGMILKMAAPILMSYLANHAKSNNVQNGTDLGGLLGGLLGGGSSSSQAQATSTGSSILTSVLDQDGDGQLGLNDAVTAATKKGGLGGLLGKLFGK